MKKLKILCISHNSIYPPNFGGAIGIFYRLIYLKNRGHRISIIAPRPKNIKNMEKAESLFDDVFFYKMKPKIKKLGIAFKSLFFSYPFFVYRLEPCKTDKTEIKKFYDKIKPDIIFIEASYAYSVYSVLKEKIAEDNAKVIYVAHNIDYLSTLGVGKDEKKIFNKIFLYIQAYRQKKIELKIIKEVKNIFCVSIEELNFFKKNNPDCNIFWMPTILDVESQEADKNFFDDFDFSKLKKYKYRILFTGDLSYASNIYALDWFIKEVFPILRKNSNVCFIIVGKSPVKELIEAVKQWEHIFLFSDVQSVSPFMDIADIVVVPMFNKFGIKIKLIEALKCGKKVVARPEGLIGANLLDIIPNSDSPTEFAQKCMDVLNNTIDFEPIWRKFNEMYDNDKVTNMIESELYKAGNED